MARNVCAGHLAAATDLASGQLHKDWKREFWNNKALLTQCIVLWNGALLSDFKLFKNQLLAGDHYTVSLTSCRADRFGIDSPFFSYCYLNPTKTIGTD